MTRARLRAALALVLTLGLALGSGSVMTTAAAAAPSPTKTPPTDPLPIEIVVKPDSDVLGRPGTLYPSAMPAPPKVAATAWLVVDVDSGAVIGAQNARAQLLPASTLKTLTAVALAPQLPETGLYTATPWAAGIEGSKVGLRAGSVYSVKDLFVGLMLSSGNDTAIALSELVGGDAAAAALMNAKLRDLGATDSLAVNTSGLDAPGQVMSARDLALVNRALLDDPRLAGYVATKTYDFPGEGTDFSAARPRFQIVNHNKMLGVYPGTMGVKTGFTQAARGTFVGAADRDGRRLMCVVMHSEGLESDHCSRLLDWAYAHPRPAQPVATLDASVKASAPPAPSPAAAPTPQPAPDQPPAQSGRGVRTPVVVGVVVGLLVLAGGVLLGLRRRRN